MTAVDAAALFARTAVIGLAVAAPVGAMAVVCIQRALRHGWVAGMATGLGIATADGIYASVAAFGIAAISDMLVAWQGPLRLIGGAALFLLGLRSVVATARGGGERPSATEPDGAGVAPRGNLAAYAAAVMLTLTNPMTIVAFGAVFASAGLAVAAGPGSAAIATAGVAFGSLSWWTVLVTGVVLAGRGVGERLTVWVTRVSGVVIAAFGVLAIASALLR